MYMYTNVFAYTHLQKKQTLYFLQGGGIWCWGESGLYGALDFELHEVGKQSLGECREKREREREGSRERERERETHTHARTHAQTHALSSLFENVNSLLEYVTWTA